MNLMQASSQWANRPQDQRFETLEELYNSVHARRRASHANDIELKTINATVADDGKNIVLNHGIKQVTPSHWSFGQLAGWVKTPAEYMRRIPASLAVANLNNGIQTAEVNDGSLKFMTVVNDDGNTLQAVTSVKYGRIWDADVVKCAVDIREATGGKFYNPTAYDRVSGGIKPSGLYASDRDCFIFMIDGGSLLDVGPRAQLNRGFFMWNSETGSRTFGLTTFLFNVVCGNHIVWGAQDVKEVRVRHTGNGPYRFASEAAPSLLAYANAASAPLVSQVKRAQDYLLPVPIPVAKDEVVGWLQARKFTKGEAVGTYDTAVSEEGECRTLWQAIQGATAYARDFDFIDSRVEMETKAGSLFKLVE
jgi:hypothetical protein